jgi:hypothetical protein
MRHWDVSQNDALVRATMRDHACDRNGPPAKVIDESGDEPITAIYPTCSACGVPQALPANESTSDENESGSFVAAIKAAIDRNNKRKRQHASFFDWYDKESKHLGIAAEFCERMERQYGIAYSIASESDLEPGAPVDPPDVVLKDVRGALIGLEITELVNEEAIHAQIAGRADYFEISYRFNARAATELLHEIVADKELAAVNVCSQYADYLLLVHCAEPWLSRDELSSAIATHRWPATRGIRTAYLMFDYMPTDPYRIVRMFVADSTRPVQPRF